MKKILKENCLSLSIYDLKRCIASKKRLYSGVVLWENQKAHVNNLFILVDKLQKYVKLKYWIRNYTGDEEELIEYKVTLTTTKCNYGKERYWFSCPNYKNNQYCGKRVATLYLAPNKHHFVCRHCLNLSYKSRNINTKGKLASLDKMFNMEQVVNQLRNKIKIKYRKNLPTKKYLQLIQANEKLEDTINIVNKNMDNIFKKIDKK